MKNLILTGVIALLSISVFSQGSMGIATSNPEPSAALDLSGTDLPTNAKKGFLLPRVALLNNTDTTTIPSPAAGLTVLNTADNGTESNEVTADTFYFWNGTQWVDLADIITAKRELLPQVFFITETVGQNTIVGSNNINLAPVILNYPSANIVLNSGNNISLEGTENFRINATGNYEISGYINYNPTIAITANTNVEYIIQVSSDNGSTWTNVAKTTMVWGYGTGANSRTSNVAPIVVSFEENDLIRSIVQKTAGVDHGSGAGIRAGTGLTYNKVLKIQKLD